MTKNLGRKFKLEPCKQYFASSGRWKLIATFKISKKVKISKFFNHISLRLGQTEPKEGFPETLAKYLGRKFKLELCNQYFSSSGRWKLIATYKISKKVKICEFFNHISMRCGVSKLKQGFSETTTKNLGRKFKLGLCKQY